MIGRRARWLLVVVLVAALLPLRDRLRQSSPRHIAELLQAGDVRVRALQAGTGDTIILLLHGYGETLMTWRGVVDPLARHARVIAIDLPGFGGSDKPAGPYTLDAQVERLSALLDELPPHPVLVVGHSMGGAIALGLALARPDRVRALALIAPAGIQIGLAGLVDSVGDTKALLIGWFQAIRSFILPMHDPAWLDEPDSLARYDPTADPAFRASTAAVLSEFDFRALRTRLGEVTQPTLLIWGRQDPVIPVSVGYFMAAELPCAQLFVFDETMHRPHVERPAPVMERLIAFLLRPSIPGCYS